MLTTSEAAYKILIYGQLTEEIKIWALKVLREVPKVNEFGFTLAEMNELANLSKIDKVKTIRSWRNNTLKEAVELVNKMFIEAEK